MTIRLNFRFGVILVAVLAIVVAGVAYAAVQIAPKQVAGSFIVGQVVASDFISLTNPDITVLTAFDFGTGDIDTGGSFIIPTISFLAQNSGDVPIDMTLVASNVLLNGVPVNTAGFLTLLMGPPGGPLLSSADGNATRLAVGGPPVALEATLKFGGTPEVLGLVQGDVVSFTSLFEGREFVPPPPVTVSLPAGTGFDALAVNNQTNRVYLLLANQTLRFIDGSTDTLAVPIIAVCSPNQFGGLDVNSNTNNIYVGHESCGGVMEVVSGDTNAVIANVPLGGALGFPRVDKIRNRVYIRAQSCPEGICDGMWVVDGATNTVIDANPPAGGANVIALGGTAGGTVVNETLDRIYQNVLGNTKVINGATFQIIATLPNVVPVAANTVTNRYYVTIAGVGLGVVDGNTNVQIGTINITGLSENMDVNPNTNRLYAAATASNELVVIDGNTNTEIRRVAVGLAPNYVRVNSATGKVYVYNSGNHTLSVVQE